MIMMTSTFPVEDREVQLAEACRVGEHIDFGDLPASSSPALVTLTNQGRSM
jgi:hypothetical protein